MTTTYQPLNKSDRVLRWAGIALVATVWISALLFGLYILAFYAAALYDGNMTKWNKILPGLYQPNSRAATVGIGMHFAAGGIILVLGCIQLMERIRIMRPRLHHWIGRVYVVASLLAAVGGLVFIFVKGTIGGTVMDIGFGLYGVLMFVCAIETMRHAKARRLPEHRVWALRLFSLAIGSWLYRMDYGFWFLLADGAGHAKDFHGTFDQVMSFFFYIPNLLVVELFVRAKEVRSSSAVKITASIALFTATAFLLLGTYFFTDRLWGPAIVGWLF